MSADYTSCSGEDCPIKNSCYRFTGPKGYYQSTIAPPMEIIDGWFYCEHFWDNKQTSKIRYETKNV